jgi:hypothetical protein
MTTHRASLRDSYRITGAHLVSGLLPDEILEPAHAEKQYAREPGYLPHALVSSARLRLAELLEISIIEAGWRLPNGYVVASPRNNFRLDVTRAIAKESYGNGIIASTALQLHFTCGRELSMSVLA